MIQTQVNREKSHFGPDLNQLGPNLSPLNCFYKSSS